ncbi:MAG: TIGR03943 family protein [Chloroflexi bacterium]|nr:TIGR03943 family protein [Chloroflexota bacterium]
MNILRAWIQAAILAATGVYFLYLSASGTVTHYIAERFVWLIWFAAGMFLMLAVLSVVVLLRQLPEAAHDHHDHTHHDHDHHTSDSRLSSRLRAWAGLGIVALPVLLGVLVPANPLDSRAIEEQAASELMSIQTSDSEVIEDNPMERSILDWLRVFSLSTDLDGFNGQQAEVIGFVYHDPQLDRSNEFMVARFIVSCCVADAQPIGMVVEWPESASLREDSWVRVRGVFEVRQLDGIDFPWLIAQELTFVDQPQNPYLHP